ncbi:MAG: hypothetical protein HQL38_02255 [Alphaproteobacteria bacterium]|nr:hypothetical protein [Alphaproteobacteria bacterium]
MPDRLPPLIAATKTLASKPKWVDLGVQLDFTVPLDINGITQIGLRLRGKCYSNHPDQNVTFQIEYQFRSLSKLVPVTRLEWRPHNEHQNPNFGPAELRLIRFRASHLHRFQENYDWLVGNGQPLADNIKAKDIPFAVPLDSDPDGFAALVVLMGRLFNIDGVGAIPAPPWKAPRFL